MMSKGSLCGIKDIFKLKHNVVTLLIRNRERVEFYVTIETHISEHVPKFLAFSHYRFPGDAKGCSDAEDV